MKSGRMRHVVLGVGRGVGAALLAGLLGSSPAVRGADDALAVAEKLQEAFTTVVDKAKPTVVVITNKQVGPDLSQYQQMPPELWRFFGIPLEPGPGQGPEGPQRRAPEGRERRGAPRPQAAGKGSGVIIRADGYIVTNYHVIRESAALEVRL